MIKLILAIAAYFSFFSIGLAQMRHDNNWIFNKYWGEFVDSGAVLKFYPDAAVDYHLNGNETYLMNSSFSDRSGNLLYYTNGCVINDSSHKTIAGGDSINFGSNKWGDCLQRYGYARGPQSAMFLPKPGNVDSSTILLHLFGETLFDPGKNTVVPYTFEIRSTEIQRKKDKWTTSSKNKTLLRDTLSFSGLVATKHSNNEDWWVVIPDGNYFDIKNKYFVLLITKQGATKITTTNIGNLLTGTEQCNFAPNGTKYALYNFVETFVGLCDFDRTTGTLSNYKKLELPDTVKNGGCAFSPNSRFLYVTTTTKIWQFDIEAQDINASRTLVATYDGFTDPGYFNKPTYFWQIQQGPDCKLYINSTNITRYLSCINRPNEKGLACDVSQHSILIRTAIARTLPYFPNYRLGTPYENDCDTITSNSWLAPYLESEPLSVIPNPTNGQIELKFAKQQTDAVYTIFSVTGEMLQTGKLLGTLESATVLLVDSIPGGIYHVLVKDNQTMIGAAKFVVIR